MAGQNIDRRDALRYIAIAAAASGFPGFRQWSFAFAPQQAVQMRPASYSPVFFTPAEYRTIDVLTALIIRPTARPAPVKPASPSSSISWCPKMRRFSTVSGTGFPGWMHARRPFTAGISPGCGRTSRKRCWSRSPPAYASAGWPTRPGGRPSFFAGCFASTP